MTVPAAAAIPMTQPTTTNQMSQPPSMAVPPAVAIPMAQLMPITAQMRAANAGQSSVAQAMPQQLLGSVVGVALPQWPAAQVPPHSTAPSSFSHSATASQSSSQQGSPLHDPGSRNAPLGTPLCPAGAYGGSSASVDAHAAKFAALNARVCGMSSADLTPATFVDLSNPTSTASMSLGALDMTEKAALHGRGHAPWSADEDAALMVHVRELGQVWRKIAGLLPGRTDDAVRNRWLRLSQLSGGDTSAGSGNASDVKVEPFAQIVPADHQFGLYLAQPTPPPMAKLKAPKEPKSTGG
eukprot:6394217-Prymnesium_polylepis.1